MNPSFFLACVANAAATGLNFGLWQKNVSAGFFAFSVGLFAVTLVQLYCERRR